MANETYALLNAVRTSLKWEDRIPEINKNSLHNLTNLAPDELNQFINVLVKVVKQEIYTTTFNREDNPFADFFREMLPAGYAIEDLYVDLITGAVPAWNDDGSFALSRKKPEISATYHKQNYEMQYKTSTSYPQVKSAFLTVEGIDNFIATVNATLYSSCEYDIYLQCIELLSTAYHNGAIKPVYGHTLDNESGIKKFVKELRTTQKEFTFMNNTFNAMGYSTRSKKGDVVIVIKANALETINVDYLAGVFNMNRAEIESRIIEVPSNYGFGSFGDNVLAMVLDKRFMKVVPTLYEGSAIMNPASLVTNTFLTTAWVFSYAGFINAVALCKGEAPETAVAVDANISDVVTVDNANPAVNSEVTVTVGAGVSELYFETPDGFRVELDATEGDTTFTAPIYAVVIKGVKG